jgi:adenine-specific DNA-methyltransferase
LRYIKFNEDLPAVELDNFWTDSGGEGDKIYVVQTSRKIIERCLLMTTDPGDLVLDPTMGSGTTAYVAEQWGRRWITTDTARVALALARTRLMSARYSFYVLADSPDGVQKEMEVSGFVQQPRSSTYDLKQGFVYERMAHITLRDIANNEEIDVIHERWQPYLEERRMWLKETLGEAWEEWEIPRELTEADGEVQRVLGEYWQARGERQKQIDESISRNSEREILYDRPYEDRRKIRVTGPFTVESLSPHRIFDPGYAEAAARHDLSNIGSYEQMVIDNLRIAGVQNTRREERLKFDTLEPFAGVWLHATGIYTDANGEEKNVAVSIGSEHGTVTARQIKEAAKESVKGIGYDLLLICGFAFDAAASEETKRYGKLDVQIVRMNSDLMMGSVLKQTDRANLFTIFGEPDMSIEQQPDGRYRVEIRGLDIYDPTTGQIRNSSTDDIACWFIDTAYNDERFFVRHAYFLGKDDAYDNLKRALRAEINEDAWQALYDKRSLPFERPESGRIAVKVINHYGDEVLKVYTLDSNDKN